MRAREIYGPLTDGGVVKPIHELRKMLDGKGTGNFAAFLALRQNLTEQPQRKFFVLPHVRRTRSEEHTSELQSHLNLVCRLLLEKKKRIPPRLHSRAVHRMLQAHSASLMRAENSCSL